MRLAVALVILSATLAPSLARAQNDAGADVADVPSDTVDSDAHDPLDDPATDEEDSAARQALEAHEPRDPVAEEAERTGAHEGSALSGDAPIATEIAALSDRSCLRALVRAGVPFARVRGRVPGITTPVRVTGPIRGVTWRDHGRPSTDELMDCRMAVAMVRYAPMLRAMGIHEVRHLSLYRAPSEREVARSPLQTRHPGGLAIDAAIFLRDNGDRLVVERDFHGRRGRPVCGPTARVAALPAARFLRGLFCDTARRGYFHVVLGPNFNFPHRNHFHLEIARGVSWQFVR